MNEKEKRKEAIICFLPLVPFFITMGYYMILFHPLAHGYHEPKSASAIISSNYTSLFILLAIYSCVAVGVLIYCLVHLIKIRALNSANKVIWALVLVTFIPLSFILFWNFKIKKEPRNEPVYPDIN